MCSNPCPMYLYSYCQLWFYRPIQYNHILYTCYLWSRDFPRICLLPRLEHLLVPQRIPPRPTTPCGKQASQAVPRRADRSVQEFSPGLPSLTAEKHSFAHSLQVNHPPVLFSLVKGSVIPERLAEQRADRPPWLPLSSLVFPKDPCVAQAVPELHHLDGAHVPGSAATGRCVHSAAAAPLRSRSGGSLAQECVVIFSWCLCVMWKTVSPWAWPGLSGARAKNKPAIPGPSALTKEIVRGCFSQSAYSYFPSLSWGSTPFWVTPSPCLDLFAAVRNCLTR